MSTIYQCWLFDASKRLVRGPDAETETNAITYLESHGGGEYRNILHRFEMPVKARKPTVD